MILGIEMKNLNHLQDHPPNIGGIATKKLTNMILQILAKLPHLETAVIHPDHLSLGEKGMIRDPNPRQIIIEGNAKFQHRRSQKNREMVRIHLQEGKGMILQDLQVPEIQTTKKKQQRQRHRSHSGSDNDRHKKYKQRDSNVEK